MGDGARFRVFADWIVEHWPDRTLRIADVAGGKGYLRAELWLRGYQDVVVYDKRRERFSRPHYRYAFFDANTPESYDLVVGMHPDGATDQIIAYAARRQVPFAVVPCCPIPGAYPYDRRRPWRNHLYHLAKHEGFQAEYIKLSFEGANCVLVGEPREQELRAPHTCLSLRRSVSARVRPTTNRVYTQQGR